MSNNKTIITAETGKQEIIITREFDAPRELVFKAHNDSKLQKQWMGPRELKTTYKKFEPKNGGAWRFIQKDESGKEFAFHGVFHEIKNPRELS